jgi:hypothetical protein
MQLASMSISRMTRAQARAPAREGAWLADQNFELNNRTVARCGRRQFALSKPGKGAILLSKTPAVWRMSVEFLCSACWRSGHRSSGRNASSSPPRQSRSRSSAN